MKNLEDPSRYMPLVINQVSFVKGHMGVGDVLVEDAVTGVVVLRFGYGERKLKYFCENGFCNTG